MSKIPASPGDGVVIARRPALLVDEVHRTDLTDPTHNNRPRQRAAYRPATRRAAANSRMRVQQRPHPTVHRRLADTCLLRDLPNGQALAVMQRGPFDRLRGEDRFVGAAVWVGAGVSSACVWSHAVSVAERPAIYVPFSLVRFDVS